MAFAILASQERKRPELPSGRLRSRLAKTALEKRGNPSPW